MFSALALFQTSGNNLSYYPFKQFPDPTRPIQALYFPNQFNSQFTVYAGTMLYVPLVFVDDSPPILGDFPVNARGAEHYFTSPEVGAAIFGHFGDRIGRKKTLVTTLLMTGLVTFAVGLVPTYASIGVWGAVLLIILRIVQGVGVGGECGGSVLLSMEWARTNAHRGFIAAWPQFGLPVGLLLANLAMLAFSALSGDQFLVWGWRIPFLLSIIMVGVGLYIRLGVLETPSFRRLLAENRIERTPALEVIKRRPKLIILTAFAHMGEQAPAPSITRLSLPMG